MSGEGMTFGAGGRPLGTGRDRQAEELRLLLRSNGFAEFGERQGGFVVEDPGEGPLLLVYVGGQGGEDFDLRYYEVLRMAGYLMEPDVTGEGDGWQIWPRPAPGDHALCPVPGASPIVTPNREDTHGHAL